MLNLVYLTYAFTNNQNRTKQDIEAEGYKINKILHNKKTGYFGIVVEKDDNIIIIHRGIESINFYAPFATIQEIINGNQDKDIIQIGHSLGGFLVELCYKMSSGSIESYAFDSPGGIEVLQSYGVKTTIENPSKKIEYYMASPHAINTALHHIVTQDSKFSQMIFPLKETIKAINLEEYLKMTLFLHGGMLINYDKITITDPVKDWPAGLQNGLKYFYSRNNKDGWSIFLNKQWVEVCNKLHLGIDDREEFDKFFDYFARNYLDKAQDGWKYVLPLQNLGDYINNLKHMPLLSKIFNVSLESTQSLYASWKNYHYINNNLSSEYIEYTTGQNNKSIFCKISSIVENNISVVTHLLYNVFDYLPITLPKSYQEVISHCNDNKKLNDGNVLIHYHSDNTTIIGNISSTESQVDHLS